MPFLFGDSTESKLGFDYLAFLREVIDCAVVMLECEMALVASGERWRARQTDAEGLVAAVDEFGKRASQLVVPVAQEQGATPVGRCAASVAAAIKESVEREASRVRGILAGERAELDQEEQRIRGRTRDALEKLLRTHALPEAAKEFEVSWVGPGVKASLRERTSFGIEALLALEIPASSLLVPDLKVERVADGVEVHARDAGGWLKKADKLVAQKLARYQVVGITVGSQVTVRLRAAADASAAGVTITAHGDGELSVEPMGAGPVRELAIDDRARPALKLFIDKIEAAVRALGDSRGGLVSIEIDGKPVAEHGHPRVLAERFVLAVAPTVHLIAKHSRSPGELVLRRLLGDNRREEIFVTVEELVRRYQGLPAEMRAVFAPLQLGGEAPAPAPKHAPAAAVPEPRLPPVAGELKSSPSAVPEEVRAAPTRTSPHVLPAEARSAAVRMASTVPAPDRSRPVPSPESRRASPPTAPVAPAAPAAAAAAPARSAAGWIFDEDDPTVMKPSGTPVAAPASSAPATASGGPMGDDALGRAIDAALEADEETPSAK